MRLCMSASPIIIMVAQIGFCPDHFLILSFLPHAMSGLHL